MPAPNPSPFSQYASRFINASFMAQSTSSNSQPLFYSFMNASESGEQSRNLRTDDDEDGTELRGESVRHPREEDEDVLDPFHEHAPLIESEVQHNLHPQIPAQQQQTRQHTPGWRVSAAPLELSIASSSSSDQSIDAPPDGFFDDDDDDGYDTRPVARSTLRESLLPRDGVTRPVFSLPDPRRVPLRKFNDPAWTVLYCTGLTACIVGWLVVVLVTSPRPEHQGAFPYSTLLHIVPLLTILTISSALASYAHVFLLRLAVQPAVLATAIFVPVALLLAAVWAFAGSFVGPQDSWNATVGLRLFSLVPLVCSVLSARSLMARRRQLEQTINVVHLATSILLAHPPLFALSPALLFGCMVLSLPLLSLVFRLFLVGYWSLTSDVWHYHLYNYSGWLIAAVTLFWLWSWAIARGILRVTAAGVVGAWYFERSVTTTSDEEIMRITTAALFRASGPSFGSVAAAALFLSAARALDAVTLVIHQYTTPPAIPAQLNPLTVLPRMFAVVLRSLSTYALTYIGVTGEPFFPAARRAQALTSVRRPIARGDYTILGALLLLSAAAAGTLAALGMYLFVTHTLAAPNSAPFAAWTAGAVTFLVVWYSVGLVDDIADTLYVCYCIDRDAGNQSCPEAFAVFEGGMQHNGVPAAAD
ncbi:plasma-membrane choline transporter-domain-containing protein [Auriculariales sp. MPI-PUGE-AT-0066]|nr:plasma-membrane choline transporter-domain-containing protein [Auriculariales sp. MPI-PUGE-AT-0066]